MMENRRLTPAPERMSRLAKLLGVPAEELLAEIAR
jgi:hypothetical protein